MEQQDFDTLFVGASNGVVRVTRMRSDIAHTALVADLTLQASADQGQLSNVHETTSQIGEPECPVYDNQCNVTGQAPRSQVLAAGNPGGGGCSTSAGDSRLGAQGSGGVLWVDRVWAAQGAAEGGEERVRSPQDVAWRIGHRPSATPSPSSP